MAVRMESKFGLSLFCEHIKQLFVHEKALDFRTVTYWLSSDFSSKKT